MDQSLAALFGALIGGGASITGQLVSSRLQQRFLDEDYRNRRANAVSADMRRQVEDELHFARRLELSSRLRWPYPKDELLGSLSNVGATIPRLREPDDWEALVTQAVGTVDEPLTSLPELLAEHRDRVYEIAELVSDDDPSTSEKAAALYKELVPLQQMIIQRMDIYLWEARA